MFHYLAGMCDLMLTYGAEHSELYGYTDADSTLQKHRCAISGYVFLIDRGAILWSSYKQELVTLSTVEAEYVAAIHAAKECIWLWHLIGKLFPLLITITTLHCDNQVVLMLATQDNYHVQTKHINIYYHFICKVITSNVINMVYYPTNNMTANI